MSNENLIEYLKLCWDALETSFEEESCDSNRYQYLYFATLKECMQIHNVEKLLGCGSWQPLHLNLKQNDQNDVLDIKLCNKILDFRSSFEEALTQKNVTSIANFNFPKTLENTTDREQTRFRNELAKIEKSKGILNALLKLKSWKCYPNNLPSSKNRRRLARSYLQVVIGRLNCIKNEGVAIKYFLKWCSRGKRKIKKITKWKPKQKKSRSPPSSAIPLYKDEIAAYLRHFLKLTCRVEENLRQCYAEMVILLSLCMAGARQHDNVFKLREILKITKDSLRPIKTIHARASSSIVKNARRPELPLQFVISEEFLDEEKIWVTDSLPESLSPYPFCKIVKIQDKFVLIGERIAHAVELMGSFSITESDVDNRLQEAFKIIGLTQSSGKICPRTFLSSPHYSPGFDLRKNLIEKNAKD